MIRPLPPASLRPDRAPAGRASPATTLATTLALALALAVAWALPARALDPVEEAAQALNAQLARQITCPAGAQRRIGIFPFDESRLPITAGNAFALYEGFLGALIRGAPDCVVFLDGRGAMVTLGYLGQTGTLRETAQAHRAEIMDSLAGVDHILDGTIIEQGAELTAIFRLTDMGSGAALARIELPVPARLRDAACGAGAMPLQVATERIAAALANRASGLRQLTVLGGYFGDSDAQTGFSRLLERELVAALSAQVENPLTGRVLAVEYRNTLDASRLRAMRGLGVTPLAFEEGATTAETAAAAADGDTPAQAASGHYRLQFRYWLCPGDEAARLSVTLRGEGGRDITEIADIRLTGLPADVALRPEREPERADTGPGGAFTFQMSSQRGPNPAFRPGERLEVLFRTGRDAFLYCFYTDAEGETVQLLPNVFQIDRPGANFYRGSRVHLFPDPERTPHPDPFDLVINDATLGTEVFRCFATARDVAAELPGPLRGTSFDPIPPRYSTRMREIFEGIEGGAVAVATMTVTVLD